jgi:hypothetical protein
MRTTFSPEAPMLSLTLEGGPEATIAGGFNVAVTVTYKGPLNSTEKAKPIIFHTYAVIAQDFQVYRRKNDEWEAYNDTTTGFILVDDPDVSVNVSKHEDFVSLEAGASWKRLTHSEVGEGLPGDTNVGDVFRLRCKGFTIDWWDWGDAAEHANTEVQLLCWIKGPVTNPRDNGGRPKLVVPASNEIEFTIK